MSEPIATCADCGARIVQQDEKALSGEHQTVWADFEGEWVCPVTGNEHEPGEPNRPVQVIVKYRDTETMMLLSLAEYGNFIANPIIAAVDDGEAAWDLEQQNPERLASLAHWARNLFRVTA